MFLLMSALPLNLQKEHRKQDVLNVYDLAPRLSESGRRAHASK